MAKTFFLKRNENLRVAEIVNAECNQAWTLQFRYVIFADKGIKFYKKGILATPMTIGTNTSTRFDDLSFDRESIKTLACEVDRRTPIFSNQTNLRN